MARLVKNKITGVIVGWTPLRGTSEEWEEVEAEAPKKPTPKPKAKAKAKPKKPANTASTDDDIDGLLDGVDN